MTCKTCHWFEPDTGTGAPSCGWPKDRLPDSLRAHKPAPVPISQDDGADCACYRGIDAPDLHELLANVSAVDILPFDPMRRWPRLRALSVVKRSAADAPEAWVISNGSGSVLTRSGYWKGDSLNSGAEPCMLQPCRWPDLASAYAFAKAHLEAHPTGHKPLSPALEEARKIPFLARGDRVAQGFVVGVKQYEVFHDTQKSVWCLERGYEHVLSYDGHAPAHHTYWFKSLDQAQAFRETWAGDQVGEIIPFPQNPSTDKGSRS